MRIPANLQNLPESRPFDWVPGWRPARPTAPEGGRRCPGAQGFKASLRIAELALMAFLIFTPSCRRATHEAARQTIRLALTRGSYNYLPLYVAGPSGCFDRAQVGVQLEETSSVPKSMQALLGGSVDVAAGGYTQMLSISLQGQPVQAFCLLQRYPGFVLLVSPVTKRSIRQIKDLRGANVGVFAIGSDSHLLLEYILRTNGLAPDEIRAIATGSAATNTAALEHGTVDAGLAVGTTISYLQKRHPNIRILVDTRSRESVESHFGLDELPMSVLYSRKEWLQQSPKAAQRLTLALACATKWLEGHTPEEIRNILPQSIRTPEADADEEAIRFTKPMLSPDLFFRPEIAEGARRILSVATANEALSKLDVKQTYTNQFLSK